MLSQSDIQHITNIPVDFIIDNNFFQLKTVGFELNQFKFVLFKNSNFPKDETDRSFKEKINFYNSKICNTLILVYSKTKKIIIPYLLTYNNLLIESNNQNKNEDRAFNFETSKGITCYHQQSKTIQFININISKGKNNTQIIKQYLLSNQIKKLEQQNRYQNLLNYPLKIKNNINIPLNKKTIQI